MNSGKISVIVAVVRRPGLWATSLVEAWRLVPGGWWRRRPFMPVPDRRLIEFRAVTQYGDPHHDLVAADVVAWLEWCQIENRRRRSK